MNSALLESVDRLIALAIEEDVGEGDLTTLACVPEDAVGEAVVVSRQALVVSGSFIPQRVFDALAPGVEVRVLVPEGQRVYSNRELLGIRGPLRTILTGERICLNFMGRLCGISTMARRFQRRAGAARVLDTRKTTPGWRALEKYAVAKGGAHNHRRGLFDQLLIKENHVLAAGGMVAAIEKARAGSKGRPIQVEVRNREELVLALEAGVDSILLDNMSPTEIAQMVRLTGGRAVLEASGGIDARTIGAVAETGVDRISVGALTHSAPVADLSLLVRQTSGS